MDQRLNKGTPGVIEVRRIAVDVEGVFGIFLSSSPDLLVVACSGPELIILTMVD